MRLAERGLPVFDYYGLVKSRARGEEMVAAMAGGQAVLLRGHGLTTAASTVAGAVITALHVNRLAKMTAAVAATVRAAAGALLEDLGLFDVYRGTGIGPDERSLTFGLRLCAFDHTLSGAEVAEVRATVISAVEQAHGARLRG